MRRLALVLLAVAAALAAAPPAGAGVAKYGPASAKTVLVLVPGLGGGAGNFSLVGPDLVERVAGLQVWAVDRPVDRLEDATGFRSGDPVEAYGYYFERQPVAGRTFDPNVAQRHPEARAWGLPWALSDLRRVVREAGAGGRRTVLLGGHSLGAATALAYAAWDFAGVPGHRDLKGLVLIDGGQLGTFGSPTAAEARAQLAKLRGQATPFEDRLALGIPWVFGVLGHVAALYALTAGPEASALARSPLVPASFRPAGEPSNAGFFAFAARQAGISVERCGLDRAGAMVAARTPDAFDWYFPTRLRIDLVGAASLSDDPVTRLLGLRLRHLRAIDLPVYAFGTADVPGTLAGARAFLARSSSPRAQAVLAQDATMRHADPLCAPWERSRFLQTLVPWLRARR